MKNNKSLGQHWLKNREILDEIALLSVKDGVKLCLEIGPGLGTLTSSLFKQFDKILAIELDKNLANNLPKSFPGKNLTVENKDFLDFDLESINEPYVVAGNIPYYITSPIIQKVLSAKNKPARVALLIQKEVAERIAAEKGHSLLSLIVRNKAEVELGPVVLRGMFTPPPKVDSQVLILNPRKESLVKEDVFEIIKIGFISPRKKLIANLSSGLKTSKEGLKKLFLTINLNPNCRPSDLSLENWQKLKTLLTNHKA